MLEYEARNCQTARILKLEKYLITARNPAYFILYVVRSALIIKTMEQTFVFIYAKGHEIKVLNIEESKRLDTELKSDGWKHTNTLDACTFIQYLHNNCDNIRKEIKNLSKCES